MEQKKVGSFLEVRFTNAILSALIPNLSFALFIFQFGVNFEELRDELNTRLAWKLSHAIADNPGQCFCFSISFFGQGSKCLLFFFFLFCLL